MTLEQRLNDFIVFVGTDMKGVNQRLDLVNNVDNTRDIDKQVSTATQQLVNTVLSGSLVATVAGTPVAGTNVYDVSTAGIYANYGNIEVTAADLLAGPVRLVRNPDNTWTKLAMTIPLGGYVNKTTDIVTVTVPASKNLFDVTTKLWPNQSIGSGIGTLQSSSSSDTFDYINISAYPVGTVFCFRSISKNKGVRRFATYTQAKNYFSGSSQEPQRLYYTKTSTSEYWMRPSVEYAAQADFQIEVVASTATPPTPWVAFRAAYSYLRSVAGFILPQYAPGNAPVLLPAILAGQALPSLPTAKIMVLGPGSYLYPDGVTPLVLTSKTILGWDMTTWTQIATIPPDITITTDTIPHSKQLFDKSAIPAGNRGQLIDLGVGSTSSSSTCDTSDYIDITSVPVGTAILMKSATSGRGAERLAFYNSSKVFIAGTSPSGPLTSIIRNSAGAVYMRVSIRFAGVEDFMVHADEGTGFLAYQPFSLARQVLKTINGIEMPTGTTTVTAPVVAPTRDVMTWNLFDTSGVISDFKMDSTTGLAVSASDGSSITGKIPISPNTVYSFWGFRNVARTLSWFDISNNFISFVNFTTSNKGTATSPANAAYAQMDYSVAGVAPQRLLFQKGKDANAWISYADSLRADNKAWGKTWGKSMWVFGASVSLTRSDLYEANWPNYVKNLGLGEMQNFAVGGAGFRTGTSSNNGCAQVDQAVNEGHNAPDLVLFDLGTNDDLNNMGDLQTAMNKVENVDSLADLGTLDKTKTIEAMFYCIYKIKFLYPDARIFVTTFYQKAKPASLVSYRAKPLIDLIISGAQYTNATVIDQYNQLGILAAFENDSASGRFLRDGQHPNSDGMSLEAQFFIRRILSTYY